MDVKNKLASKVVVKADTEGDKKEETGEVDCSKNKCFLDMMKGMNDFLSHHSFSAITKNNNAGDDDNKILRGLVPAIPSSRALSSAAGAVFRSRR